MSLLELAPPLTQALWNPIGFQRSCKVKKYAHWDPWLEKWISILALGENPILVAIRWTCIKHPSPISTLHHQKACQICFSLMVICPKLSTITQCALMLLTSREKMLTHLLSRCQQLEPKLEKQIFWTSISLWKISLHPLSRQIWGVTKMEALMGQQLDVSSLGSLWLLKHLLQALKALVRGVVQR